MTPVILHIEDNPDLAESVALTFDSLGFRGEILTAQTIATGQRMIAERKEQNLPLDLILVDMELPDGTGLDLIRRIKSNPQWAAIPVVVLSNRSDGKAVSSAYALGANCYYPKIPKKNASIDTVEALFAAWANTAILPPEEPSSSLKELLGRTISTTTQASRIFTEFARKWSLNQDTGRLWLDLAMNAGNHANLLTFILNSISNRAESPVVLDRIRSSIEAKELKLAEVQNHLKQNPAPTNDQLLFWALTLFATTEPDVVGLVLHTLFPWSPVATTALRDSILRHLLRLAEAARTHSHDAVIHTLAKTLEEHLSALHSALKED